MAVNPVGRTPSWESHLLSCSHPNPMVGSARVWQAPLIILDTLKTRISYWLVSQYWSYNNMTSLEFCLGMSCQLKKPAESCLPYPQIFLLHSNFYFSCFLVEKNFVLIPQHTSPESAVTEVNSLYDVVADVRTCWNTNVNILLFYKNNNDDLVMIFNCEGRVQMDTVGEI